MLLNINIIDGSIDKVSAFNLLFFDQQIIQNNMYKKHSIPFTDKYATRASLNQKLK